MTTIGHSTDIGTWTLTATFRSGFVAYEWFEYALEQYQIALELGGSRPADAGEATLRWNTCVRMIERHSHCAPAPDERAELGLE